jgi:1-acyl-sn-glycerol-3-phosphate acyltransferase
MIFFRSLVFALLQTLFTPLFSIVSILTFPWPPLTRYRVISQWARIMMFLVEKLCGIRYRIEGAENIPDAPCVVFSNHQSAWETIAYQVILPPQVWVLKKELLRIPFFGWGLAMTSPIAIDREEGRAALKQLLDQGKDRLKSGFFVIVFPEGTRIPPEESIPFKIGGAWLATHTGVPALPIAHNAGYLWGKNAFIKRPGVITVSIGKPIDPKGMKPGALNEQAEKWVKAEMERIGKP